MEASKSSIRCSRDVAETVTISAVGLGRGRGALVVSGSAMVVAVVGLRRTGGRVSGATAGGFLDGMKKVVSSDD